MINPTSIVETEQYIIVILLGIKAWLAQYNRFKAQDQTCLFNSRKPAW